MSANTVEFDFPYRGEQHARLMLRTHPQYGKDVILLIERGQFLCRLDSCKVLVRFDDDKPESFQAAEPEDNSTTTLFINGYQKFVAKLRGSKRLRIEAPFFQEGTRVFEFNVEGLEWEGSGKGKGK